MISTTGRLLVAEPMLGDPNFERTVVLMVDHSDDGALGLVLNRPTDLPVADVAPDWAPLSTPPAVLHIGGPVEEQSGWCLGRVRPPGLGLGFELLTGDLGMVDLDLDPQELAGVVTSLRLFLGYSGWGPGQLEAELAAGAWFVLDAEPSDPFLSDGTVLWRRILARQGGPLARVSLFPPHPSLN